MTPISRDPLRVSIILALLVGCCVSRVPTTMNNYKSNEFPTREYFMLRLPRFMDMVRGLAQGDSIRMNIIGKYILTYLFKIIFLVLRGYHGYLKFKLLVR